MDLPVCKQAMSAILSFIYWRHSVKTTTQEWWSRSKLTSAYLQANTGLLVKFFLGRGWSCALCWESTSRECFHSFWLPTFL